MAYASAAPTLPEIRFQIRFPRIAAPKWRWPHLSPGIRALLMMGVLFSPAFLCDTIGYCVQRLGYTADQIAERSVSGDKILAQVQIFQVACVDTEAPPAERGRLAALAAERGWPPYPPAGPSCFKTDRRLLGIVGVTAFGVACPQVAFSGAVQRRWVAYAADHGWTDYPQAGAG